jgi:hypothetical protein
MIYIISQKNVIITKKIPLRWVAPGQDHMGDNSYLG